MRPEDFGPQNLIVSILLPILGIVVAVGIGKLAQHIWKRPKK